MECCYVAGAASIVQKLRLFSLEKTARVQLDLIPCGQARVEMEVEC